VYTCTDALSIPNIVYRNLLNNLLDPWTHSLASNHARLQGMQRSKKQANIALEHDQEGAKRRQNSLKRLTLSVLVGKVDFEQVFSRNLEPKVPEILPKFAK
jgi:hypothetical protein